MGSRRGPVVPVPLGVVALVLGLLVAAASPARAQAKSLEDIVSAVVQVRLQIEPDGRTVDSLGRQREGSGVVIDDEGLVLTIGYLMVEARAAEIETSYGRTVPAAVVGYDHETGFGLLRALLPLKTPPLKLGKAADLKPGEPVLAASYGGPGMAQLVRVAARREFAGSWEYLIDEAIFTAPPHPAWSGAALVDREGKLIGIGSLALPEVPGDEKGPGNMFVPVDLLTPILGDLIANGRPGGPGRPWLGVVANEIGGELLVTRVTPGSPAARAGVQAGASIVGVNGRRPKSLVDFYRAVWAQGGAGTTIPLEVSQNAEVRRVEITSMNRLDHLRLKSSL